MCVSAVLPPPPRETLGRLDSTGSKLAQFNRFLPNLVWRTTIDLCIYNLQPDGTYYPALHTSHTMTESGAVPTSSRPWMSYECCWMRSDSESGESHRGYRLHRTWKLRQHLMWSPRQQIAEQAESMARWLAKRLNDGLGGLTGSIPTTVKTLDCISHIRIRVGCDVINRW